MKQSWIWVVKQIIGWLWKRYKWLMVETVVPEGSHIHRNGKRKKAIV